MKPPMLVVNLTPSSTAFGSDACGVVGVVDALQALHGQLGGGGAARRAAGPNEMPTSLIDTPTPGTDCQLG
jgi:hypothetical protein